MPDHLVAARNIQALGNYNLDALVRLARCGMQVLVLCEQAFHFSLLLDFEVGECANPSALQCRPPCEWASQLSPAHTMTS
jgi:hypothetical protein